MRRHITTVQRRKLIRYTVAKNARARMPACTLHAPRSPIFPAKKGGTRVQNKQPERTARGENPVATAFSNFTRAVSRQASVVQALITYIIRRDRATLGRKRETVVRITEREERNKQKNCRTEVYNANTAACATQTASAASSRSDDCAKLQNKSSRAGK